MQNSLKKLNQTILDRADVAESRITFGLESASALRRATMRAENISEESREILFGLCRRISLCCSKDNHFVAEDLHNANTGELFDANGTFWNCGSRLCPSCVSKMSRRARRELRFSVDNQKLFVGENYQFITLTMPNPNLPLLQTREILNFAWSLFRKRKYFQDRIRGGSKNEEFTITENGYHYHLHLLCITRFLSYDVFRSEWTECLEKAFEAFNVPFCVNTADNMAMVKVKKVSSSQRNLESSIQEVCKYVTKSDSWEKLSQTDLIEICLIEHFPRMFDVFGCFREQRKINKNINNVEQIADSEFVEIEQKPILDTKEISDGNRTYQTDNLPEIIPKKEKQIRWREFILNYGLGDYLNRLDEQVERTREVRKIALRMRYPYAKFASLDGTESF